MELLLFSNSATLNQPWLSHLIPEIKKRLNGRRTALFIPFANISESYDSYTARTAAALAELNLSITGIHNVTDTQAALATAEMIITGGGNTFHLLKECRQRGLLPALQQAVTNGALYVGWSAGANLACPTIRTTNDMPIVDTGGLDALNLFPIQINPHFTNALPAGHQGETREQRIRELLSVDPEVTVIGLPEGNWIQVSEGQAICAGAHTSWLFKAGEPPVAIQAGYRFY